jgi:RNA polymerase sigma-70 factor (ECF subfamily)
MAVAAATAEARLVEQIRSGDQQAWQVCIERFEGRLLAFANSRLRKRADAEDVVQETFVGFLVSLPHYDPAQTPLEGFLFTICARKIIDVLRRSGRRPTLSLEGATSDGSSSQFAGRSRVASSMARSRERRGNEESVLAECLSDLIRGWKQEGELERLKCIELLLVRGLSNKTAAEKLGITEQAVANHKHFVVAKLKTAAVQARLSDTDWQALGVE